MRTQRVIFFGCAMLAMLLPVQAAVFRVADYGAKPDTSTNTAAIQKTIDAAAEAGGGVVTFGPGTYRSGAIFLKSNVRLDLPEGTVLQAIQDDRLYPDRPTRVAGIEMEWPAALINVYQQTNASITGKGTIDGNGEYWWHKFWGKDGKSGMLKDYQARGLRWAVDYDCKRVRALAVFDSSDVDIQGITILRSGFWSLTLTYCQDITVDGVIIRANINGFGPSSDGIDIDSCRKVLVQNCDIDCNDDNICLKAGRDWDGLRVNRPTEDITIRNCVTRSGHGMLTLGSETSGGIRRVEVSGLKAFGTSNGVRFKSARVRGGVIEDIVLRDITMESVENPFHFELNWYPAYSYPTIPPEIDRTTMPVHWNTLTRQVEPPELGIPEFRNITISDVTATGASQAIYANAFPEKPIHHLKWENVRIEAHEPGRISNAADWTMKDVVVRTPSKNKLKVIHSSQVELPQIIITATTVQAKKPDTSSPFILGMGNPDDGGDEPADWPTVFLIGDSSVKSTRRGQQGWGEVIDRQFDTNRIHIANRASAGCSSRTYYSAGTWDKVLAEIKPGDFVLIQFGHNESGALEAQPARASLEGTSDSTLTVTNQATKAIETVHTYGWYLKQYIADIKGRGATAVVLSSAPRNSWDNGRVACTEESYAAWAGEAARSGGARYIDLNAMVAERYNKLGPDKVNLLFDGDHIHTTPEGAALNADIVAKALAQLQDIRLAKYLKSAASN
jgi:lysophospholipase L1-like esterase